MTASLEKKVWVEICLHQHSIICRELYFEVMMMLIYHFLLPQTFLAHRIRHP